MTRKDGRILSTTGMEFVWIDPEPIEAEEALIPIKLCSSQAEIFADLHLILSDLTFSNQSLSELACIGEEKKLIIKAFTFSALISYARCFNSSIRKVRLTPETFQNLGHEFDYETHQFLISLRNKHIAHSVNDFESCQSIAIVKRKTDGTIVDGSAIGVIQTNFIGFGNKERIRAISHIEGLCEALQKDIIDRRQVLYNDFKAESPISKGCQIAPMKLPAPDKANERR